MRMYVNSVRATQYVQSVTWSGSARQAPRTVAFSLAFSPLDGTVHTPKVKIGDRVTLYNDARKQIFLGYVTSRERKSEAGTLSYTAKDNMMHLLRSRGTYRFQGKKPEQAARAVCADVGVPVGSLAKTGVSIGRAFFSERPIYEIIMAGYTKAHQKNGKQYIAQMDGKKLSVIEKGKVIQNLRLRQGERIITSVMEETNDNMVNRVAIYNADNQRIGEISDKGWVKKYGVFQEALTVEKGNGKKEAGNLLTGIERTASVSCFGDSRCISGRGVRIRDTETGLTGVFWIENDTHTWQDGVYTMELGLTFKNIMDMQEADAEPEKDSPPTPGTAAGIVAGSTLNGRRVQAEYTAYYAAPGSRYACGEVPDPSKDHVAAPASIPFNTQIQIQGTGTNRDGGVYEVKDRGGLIKIWPGDVYRFDILMATEAECIAWGIRKGYAVIGDGTGFSSAYTTSGNGGGTVTERAVSQMEAWANDPAHGYDQSSRWGERGDYDCSSAVITAWQMAGVPVKSRGATYTGNMHGVFVACGFQDVTASVDLATGTGLQRGDVLLNHSHHTAMYSGNGAIVQASSNEFGGITGGAPGDQTGGEFHIRPYYNYPWNSILRYAG